VGGGVVPDGMVNVAEFDHGHGFVVAHIELSVDPSSVVQATGGVSMIA
jgi:hypothetical protein